MSGDAVAIYFDSNAFIMAVETRGADERAVRRLFRVPPGMQRIEPTAEGIRAFLETP